MLSNCDSEIRKISNAFKISSSVSNLFLIELMFKWQIMVFLPLKGFWSSYRKLVWVKFQPTTTELRSDTLTNWAIRSIYKTNKGKNNPLQAGSSMTDGNRYSSKKNIYIHQKNKEYQNLSTKKTYLICIQQ